MIIVGLGNCGCPNLNGKCPKACRELHFHDEGGVY